MGETYTNRIFSFYYTFASVYVHKPARVLKLLSASALVVLCRLYSDGSRCKVTENCFNLARAKEEMKVFDAFKLFVLRVCKTVTMDSEPHAQNLRKGLKKSKVK